MSEEAPKKSEELLLRYAKKRRAQLNNFSLHPATRQLLQGEVARQHRRTRQRASGALAWFAAWRGRIAIGVGTVAAIFVSTWLAWIHQESNQPMRLAGNELATEREQLLREPRPPGAPGTASEGGEKVALASTPQASDEARNEPGQKDQQVAFVAPTLSLTPVASSSAGAPASDFFFQPNNSIPTTNLFAYDEPKILPPSRQPISPAASGVARSYFGDGTVNPSPSAVTSPPAGSLTGGVLPAGARFGIAKANTDAPAVSVLDANAAPAQQASSKSLVANAQRLADSSLAPSRLDAGKAQLDDLASSANRPVGQEGLALNRRMTAAPRGAAGAAQGGSVQDSPAAVDNAGAALPEAKAKADVALALPTPPAKEAPGVSATAVQYFQQVPSGRLPQLTQLELAAESLKKAEKPMPGLPVLDRFTVEQQGDRLRLRDADGSVYEGLITEPTVAAASTPVSRDKDAPLQEKAVPPASPRTTQYGEYSFRASGSNVTLRQIILVNGRFSEQLEPTATPARSPDAPPPVTAQRALTFRANPFGRGTGVTTNRISTIEGTVRIGTAQERPFKAIPTSR